MRHISRTNGCWVDVYDGPVFEGRLDRFNGPSDSPQSINERKKRIGSIIVGPEARAVVQWRQDNRSQHRTLGPMQIVPDVKTLHIKGNPTLELVISKATKTRRLAA